MVEGLEICEMGHPYAKTHWDGKRICRYGHFTETIDRCTGLTNNLERCKRRREPGEELCWQHMDGDNDS